MPSRLPFARFETHESGYERWRSYEDGREVYVYVHRLIGVAEHGFEAMIDKHAHHDISIPWANWGANIEPRDPPEHGNYHLRGQAMEALD